MTQAPPRRPSADERLDALEELIGRIIARAAEHPAGRKILAFLGLS
jgi:hypothetical protein